MKSEKLKKLTLKKETISSLNDDEMSMHKGGTDASKFHACVTDRCTPVTYVCTPSGAETYCPC